jgi:signal transduction histidine kinase
MEMPALLQIEIQDTGIGIAKDKCAKIFEPFYQVDSGTTRKYEGAGLGLAISKDVINHLGGDIGIESQAGKGTTIWFSLPLGQAV